MNTATLSKTAQENISYFKTQNPEVWAWIERKTDFNFAVSLGMAVAKYGDLTENQLAAARRCMDRDVQWETTRAARPVATPAPVVDASSIAAALQRALDRSGGRPKLYVLDFRFQFAPTTGRNAGSIYVTNRDKVYLGRITDGHFHGSNNATPETAGQVAEIARDPRAAAIAHGFRTGNCACCGRLLTDPESVSRGIGPICASNFGW